MGGRITNVMVWSSLEYKQECSEMVDEKNYNVVMYDFLAYGGDKFEDLREKKYKIRQGTYKLISTKWCFA